MSSCLQSLIGALITWFFIADNTGLDLAEQVPRKLVLWCPYQAAAADCCPICIVWPYIALSELQGLCAGSQMAIHSCWEATGLSWPCSSSSPSLSLGA